MNRKLKLWFWTRNSALNLIEDRSALAAVEFAMILPIMLVLFLGTVEFSSAVAVDRKVNLMAHTLSDLVSQSPTNGVSAADLSTFFQAGSAMMYPYSATPLKLVVSELYINPTTHKPQVIWSVGYLGATPLPASSQVPVPTALDVDGTYLIYSQISYLYTPAIGYVMSKAGVTLSASGYTRPRQYLCVYYPQSVSGSPTCQTSYSS